MQVGTGTTASSPGAGHAGGSPDPLLRRVRQLFLGLAGMLLLVEVVELVDATTPVWPQRLAGVVGVLTAAAAVLVVRRLERTPPLVDAVFIGSVVLTGWGVGRVGGVLAMLLGLALLRTQYGSRRAVATALSGLLLAYVVVGVLVDGWDGLVDLGYVVVATGIGAFGTVLRQVAESVARHDVGATWDRVLGVAAHRVLAAGSPTEIDRCLATVSDELDRDGRRAAGGLLVVPPAGDLGDAPLEQSEDDGDTLARDLHDRLRRLSADARVARQLLSSEQRYRRLAEVSRDGIYLRSATNSTAFPYVNEAGRALLGDLDKPGAPGIDLTRIHRDDRATLVEVLLAEPYVRTPLRVRLLDDAAPDGVRWVELVETPAAVLDGRLVTVQGTVRDVTATRHEELALEQALDREHQAAERLRHVDDIRAMFLAAVSHELRTPLAGLLGAAHTLSVRNGSLSPAQSTELAEVVERQSARLVALLDDLLDVERLSRGQVRLDPQPVALLALALRVAASFEQDARRLVVDGDPDLVLHVDLGHVERILHNLVRNALKHTPNAAQVRVRAEAHPEGGLLVVEDDGPGIPQSLRDTLFDPFVQGPASGASPSPGTGIGLSLVSKFAELHGGRAWVEESSSGGARFVVLLADGCSGPVTDDGLDGRVTLAQ